MLFFYIISSISHDQIVDYLTKLFNVDDFGRFSMLLRVTNQV